MGGQRVVLLEQLGSAALDQVFGIAGLVVIDRRGERHQHTADAHRAQLGQGGSAGPAHHHIGPVVGGGHVLDEGIDTAAHAGLAIGLQRLFMQLLAALVPDLDAGIIG